jgi:hypothetical protein
MSIYGVSFLQQFSFRLLVFRLLAQIVAVFSELSSEEYRFDFINCFNSGGKEIKVRKG